MLEAYLRGIQRNLYEVSEFQWTSYGVLGKVLGHEAHELLLDSSITIFFDIPVDSSRWQIRDEQKPVKPLEWRIEQENETINAHLRYDSARFDRDAVHQVVADFESVLKGIVSLPPQSLVRSLVELVTTSKATMVVDDLSKILEFQDTSALI